MTELERVLERVLDGQRGRLAASTHESLGRYARQMLGLAAERGLVGPCQELYDAFAADDRGSPERRSMHVRLNRLVDAEAGTRAVAPDGLFYNEPDPPSPEEADEEIRRSGLPARGVDIAVLAVRAESVMGGLGLSDSTVGQYRRAWRELAARTWLDSGSTAFDEEVAAAFAEEARRDASIPEWRRKLRRRSAEVLAEVWATGTFEWRSLRERPRAPTPELEGLRAEYAGALRSRNLAEATVGLADWVLRRALEFSGASSLGDVAALGAGQVRAVVGRFADICTVRSLATVLPALRRSLDFLGEAGYCAEGLSGTVLSPHSRRGGPVTFLEPRGEERLLRFLAGATARDRAMVLLALRLGLRDSDIRSLRFEEIDWERDRIRLTQMKTGVALTLPLPTDVGNAIVDYIEHERPADARGYPYVFVRRTAPHRRLASLYTVCSRALRASGAVAEGEGPAGMHLLRRTLARRLLESSVPGRVLGDVLGHSSPESDKAYISLDARMLSACALGLAGIEPPDWCEGGDWRA